MIKKSCFIFTLLIGIVLFSSLGYAIDHTPNNIAWYTFANQTSNTTALQDKSGHGFNLTEMNHPSWNSSDGYKFDGTDDYLKAGPNAMFGNKYTIILWFKPVTVNKYKYLYTYSKGDTSITMWTIGALGFNLEYKKWGQCEYVQSGPVIRKLYLSNIDVFNVGKSYQVVTTWDGTNYKMYINGTLVTPFKDTDDATTFTNISRYFCIGVSCQNLAIPEYFSDDKIQAVQIWSTNKSATDIADLYTQGYGYNPYAGGTPSDSNTSVKKINMTWYPETYTPINCMFNVTDNSTTFKVVNVTVSWYNSTDGTTYAKRNNYNYKYVNVTHNRLYTTSVGTGSVPAGTFSNYSYWKCAINATTTAGTIWANSTARHVHPLENLTIFGPANNTVSRFQFNASYAVTDDNGGLNCTLSIWNSSKQITYYYQESSNSTTVGDGNCNLRYTGGYSFSPYYFYIDYTRPNVLFDSIWKVQHYSTIYNYTIPFSCYNQNKVKLRIYDKVSYPETTTLSCYNGYDWVTIYNYTDTVGMSGPCTQTNQNYKLFDKLWFTTWESAVSYHATCGFWVKGASAGFMPRISEEAIYWKTILYNSTVTHPTSRIRSYLNYTLPSNGVYDWQIMCIGNGASSPITSPTYRYTYDTTPPSYSSYQSDNTSTYPEIGDTFSMNATVYDLNNVNICKLAMNDTGTWANKSTYTVNAQTSKLTMSYVIQAYSTANLSRISWKVWCNDSAGNQGYSTTKTFHVIDVTYPVITLPTKGNNWNTNNRSIIGNVFRNVTFNVTFADVNLFQAYVNVSCTLNKALYFWQLVDINSTSVNKADTLHTTGKSPQRCLIQFGSADDHTAETISKYKTEKLSDGMKYTTDNEINLEIKSADDDYKDMKTKKLKDRYTFEFDYDNKELERTYIVKSDVKLYPRDNSIYPGHFVAWDEGQKTGQWIDFADATENTEVVEKIKISDYEYEVIIRPKIPEEELENPDPIKGLNILGWQVTPDITEKEQILEERYGIDDIKFSTLGGVLHTYLTYTFYIGMDMYVNGTNLYDNGLINEPIKVNATGITNYPLINRSLYSLNGTGWLMNLSNGTYTMRYNTTSGHFFPQQHTLNIQNTTFSHTFYSTQAATRIYVRSIVTNALLTGFNMTIRNEATGRVSGVNNSGTSSFYGNFNATTYNITVVKAGYYPEVDHFTLHYLDNDTMTIYLGHANTFLLYDEKTLGVFNVSSADLIQFILFCPNSTTTTVITSNTTTLPLTCAYDKFKFILDYSGTTYYRTFILHPAAGTNVSIYLINLMTTSSIYNTFYMDDLLNQYMNASIYIYKLINNNNVQITADFVDIENKIGAYLISNHEYTVEVRSATMPDKTIGTYGADISGTKTIRMYDMNVDMVQGTSYYNNLAYYMGTRNISGTPYAFVSFYDNSTDTTGITWKLYLGNASGTLLYTYVTASNNFEAIYNISGYANDTIFSTLTFIRSDMSMHTVGAVIQIGQAFFGLVHDVVDLLGGDLVQWIVIIFLSIIALSSTIKAVNMVAIAVVGLAAVFLAFGWLTIASSALAVAALIAILSLLKKGDT
jgi:hypothetical protein